MDGLIAPSHTVHPHDPNRHTRKAMKQEHASIGLIDRRGHSFLDTVPANGSPLGMANFCGEGPSVLQPKYGSVPVRVAHLSSSARHHPRANHPPRLEFGRFPTRGFLFLELFHWSTCTLHLSAPRDCNPSFDELPLLKTARRKVTRAIRNLKPLTYNPRGYPLT